MTYITQQTLRSYVLAFLFAAAQTDRAGRRPYEFNDAFRERMGGRRIDIALQELEGDELIEDIGDDEEVEEFTLTLEGYETAERAYLAPDNSNFKIIADALIAGFTSGQKVEKIFTIEEPESLIPASDRFVEFGHNTAGYSETIDAVEQAVEAVRQSNSLAPEERSWIQANLEIGLGALRKAGKLLLDGLKTFVLEPLKAALTGVSEEKLKSAINFAVATVKSFLGL